jgi:hypothetical protein
MSFRISFTLNRRDYTALVTEEAINGSHMWVLELDNGNIYLFSKEAKGWHCPELGKETCRTIGKAIDAGLAELELH